MRLYLRIVVFFRVEEPVDSDSAALGSRFSTGNTAQLFSILMRVEDKPLSTAWRATATQRLSQWHEFMRLTCGTNQFVR